MRTIGPVSSRASISAAAAFAFALLGAAGPASASSIINFSASTTGCFTATTCTPTQTTVTVDNLTFTGETSTTGSIDLGLTSILDPFALGAFSVVDPTKNINISPENYFDLQVAFTLPTNAGSTTYSATLVGKITGGPNDTFTVDFDQTPILFNFSDAQGSGQFTLAVTNDPTFGVTGTVPNLLVTPTSIDLLGRIVITSYTPSGNGEGGGVTGAVPEPASMLLLGTGLLAVGVRFRHKK